MSPIHPVSIKERLRARASRLAVISFLFLSGVAHAGSASLTWNAPTVCADGSALSNCAVTAYKVYSGLQGQPKTLLITLGSVLSFNAVNLPVGVTCFHVTALAGAAESVPSNESCKTIQQIAPGAPVLTVASTTVFTVTKAKDKFVMLAVGSVPASTRCDPLQCLGAGPIYCVVPSDTVTWAGTVRANLVVALCG